MRRIGYIRTSTGKQIVDRQILSLKEHCDVLFVESGVSATRKNRPEYEKAIESLRPGDQFVVCSLDRAYRSVIDALRELERLKNMDVEFRSLTQNFDTAKPEGKLLFTIIAALAEWERSIISQRTQDGLFAARKRGKVLGRPNKLSGQDIARARHMLDSDPDVTLSAIAQGFNVAPITLTRSLRKAI